MTPPNSEPTPADRESVRARATAIRQARAIRTRAIRRRVVAGATALFAAAWLTIGVTLVAGRDPALASKTTSAATTAQVTAGSSTKQVVTSSSGSAATGTSTAATGTSTTAQTTSPNASASSVTTRES
jgi:hypothetical protein